MAATMLPIVVSFLFLILTAHCQPPLQGGNLEDLIHEIFTPPPDQDPGRQQTQQPPPHGNNNGHHIDSGVIIGHNGDSSIIPRPPLTPVINVSIFINLKIVYCLPRKSAANLPEKNELFSGVLIEISIFSGSNILSPSNWF